MGVPYHSLVEKSELLPQPFKINATADDETIKAVRHRNYTIERVQFHLESIKIKANGLRLLEPFLELNSF